LQMRFGEETTGVAFVCVLIDEAIAILEMLQIAVGEYAPDSLHLLRKASEVRAVPRWH